MRAKANRKILIGIAATLVLCLSVAMVANYILFVSKSKDREVETQLSEVYGQVNHQFTVIFDKKWNMLEDSMIAYKMADNDSEIEEYSRQMQSSWKFTHLFFISEDGSYITADGAEGNFDMSENAEKLFDKKENVIFVGSTDSSGQAIICAIPTEAGVFKGKSFTAVGASFDNDSMMEVFSDTTYSGYSHCYIIKPNGEILLKLHDTDANFHSYFDMLKNDHIRISNSDKICDAIRNMQSGCVPYSVDGEGFYLYYQPMEIHDWVLVGMVPGSFVGRHVKRIAAGTTVISLLFVILVILAIMIFIFEKNRQLVFKKDEEIAYRDSLFEILAGTTSNIFIVIKPDDTAAEYVTSNTDRVLGIPSEKIMANTDTLYQVQDRDYTLRLRDKMISLPCGEMMVNEMVRHNVKTGKTLYFEDFVYHVKSGENERFIYVLIDHTDDRENRENLKTALEIANSANRSKSAFLSSMSHDIRTPMNAILGFPPLLDKDADNPEKVRDYSSKIQAAGQHLMNIINDILDMSKIESGKASLKAEVFTISKVIDNLRMVIQPQAAAKNQKFRIYVHDLHHDRIEGDDTKLSQILMNILSNAVKYTDDGGKITLTIEELPQTSQSVATFRFTAEDNGIGMSEEYQKTIFDPFSREESDAAANIGGTGLGMAIVKSLVDLMGGYITVESTQGEGSIFTVEIGFCIHRDEAYDALWQAQKPYTGLVIDNDIYVCKNIVSTVAAEGIKMSYALDEESAMKMVHRAMSHGEPYDMILIDFDDKKLQGDNIAIEIRNATKSHKPLIIVRTASMSRAEAMAEGIEIDGYLSKPFFMSALKDIINSIDKPSFKGDDHHALQGLHILAAEDYELNAEVLKATLEMNGVTCDICENGKQTVERFENSEPGYYDLILMDIQMPVMDGYEATSAIRNSSHPYAQRIPIIAMSANAFTEDMRKAYAVGMNDYLTKPIDVDAMIKTIAGIVRKM